MGRKGRSRMGKRLGDPGQPDCIGQVHLFSNERPKTTRRVVVPPKVGRILDANIPTARDPLGGTGKLVVLPCGVQLAFDSRGSLVLCRTPSTFGLTSCPRITLDEAAAALDGLAQRLQAVERMGLEILGEGPDTKDPTLYTNMVRAEVRDQDLAAAMPGQDQLRSDGDTPTDVDDLPRDDAAER